tara:strand:- start:487 stop:852 length:366 start_codon:yes stop_codon:yes gene_type:complete
VFKLPNQKHRKITKRRFFNSKEEACPGTPLFRKKLDGKILGEANDDGTIFIDESVVPGSYEERKILMHEVKHMTDMKIGKMKYTDNTLTWDGRTYPRANGKVLYEGEWLPEGSKQFPWEKH